MVTELDLLLAAIVIAVALEIVLARDSFASVVAFVAYGLLLALVWVRVAAPDVALTEAAIGSGVTGGLLLWAVTRLQRAESSAVGERPGLFTRASAMLLCAVVAAALAGVVLLLPDPPPTLAPVAAASLPRTGLANPVAAVLIVYRSVDTLLEVIVLVLALVGVWSLAPDRLWGGSPGPRPRIDTGSPLTLLARFLPPLGIVIALHIFWTGSQAPGGEFPASAILASMWILAMMTGLVDAPPISRRWLRTLLVFGPALFMGTGFAGFGMGGNFLAYPSNFTKPLILMIEVALIPSIAAMLGLLVAGPPRRRQRP